MKKLFAICIVGMTLWGTTAQRAFADHPDGWGVGIIPFGGTLFDIGMWTANADNPMIYYMYNHGGFAFPFGVSLKMPFLPIFWKIGLAIGGNSAYSSFRVDIAGDYYFIDKVLVENAKLHWYAGAGGFFNFNSWTIGTGDYKTNWAFLGLGGRGVIGLSWQPIPLIEVFLTGVASLGVDIYFDATMDGTKVPDTGGIGFPSGGIGAELGIRFWF